MFYFNITESRTTNPLHCESALFYSDVQLLWFTFSSSATYLTEHNIDEVRREHRSHKSVIVLRTIAMVINHDVQQCSNVQLQIYGSDWVYTRTCYQIGKLMFHDKNRKVCVLNLSMVRLERKQVYPVNLN